MDIGFTTIGVIIGIVWATKHWRGKGTMHFLSSNRTASEPDNNSTNK